MHISLINSYMQTPAVSQFPMHLLYADLLSITFSLLHFNGYSFCCRIVAAHAWSFDCLCGIRWGTSTYGVKGARRERQGQGGEEGFCLQADLGIFIALLQFCSHQAQLMHIRTVSPLSDHLHRLAHEEGCILGPYLPPDMNLSQEDADTCFPTCSTRPA